MSRRYRALLPAALLILVAQAVSSYALRRDPFLPSPPPLALLPLHLDNWVQVREGVIEPEIRQVLGADDMLTREYEAESGNRAASLFVAYYKTQLRAKNVHDPKVCLPGAGWNPRESRVVHIAMPGSSRSFPVNYYRIAKGNNEAIVLYWFQTHNGVYTFEQQLKFHRVLDAIVDDRTDMALVRIVVPVGPDGEGAAGDGGRQFAQLIYTQMLPYFPLKEKSGS